jgi:hypothetical protein
MRELGRYLFLAGAAPYILLGLAHAWHTPFTTGENKGLSPRDPALRDAMAGAHVLLTRRTTLWLTWVGFNLSHSLGAVLFGAVVVLVGRSDASFQAQAGVFLPLANVVSLCYLAIGLRCWFRTPLIGIALAGVCFLAAWLAFALAG